MIEAPNSSWINNPYPIKNIRRYIIMLGICGMIITIIIVTLTELLFFKEFDFSFILGLFIILIGVPSSFIGAGWIASKKVPKLIKVEDYGLHLIDYSNNERIIPWSDFTRVYHDKVGEFFTKKRLSTLICKSGGGVPLCDEALTIVVNKWNEYKTKVTWGYDSKKD